MGQQPDLALAPSSVAADDNLVLAASSVAADGSVAILSEADAADLFFLHRWLRHTRAVLLFVKYDFAPQVRGAPHRTAHKHARPPLPFA